MKIMKIKKRYESIVNFMDKHISTRLMLFLVPLWFGLLILFTIIYIIGIVAVEYVLVPLIAVHYLCLGITGDKPSLSLYFTLVPLITISALSLRYFLVKRRIRTDPVAQRKIRVMKTKFAKARKAR